MEAPEINEQSLKSNSTFTFQDFALSIQAHSDNALCCPTNSDNCTRLRPNTSRTVGYCPLVRQACPTSGSSARLYSYSEPGHCLYYYGDVGADFEAFDGSLNFDFLFVRVLYGFRSHQGRDASSSGLKCLILSCGCGELAGEGGNFCAGLLQYGSAFESD